MPLRQQLQLRLELVQLQLLVRLARVQLRLALVQSRTLVRLALVQLRLLVRLARVQSRALVRLALVQLRLPVRLERRLQVPLRQQLQPVEQRPLFEGSRALQWPHRLAARHRLILACQK